MSDFFRKPIIEIRINYPSLRIGKSLTWVKFELSGFCFVKLSCPAIYDWRPIYLWVNNSKKISKATPIGVKIVVQSWYLFGYFQEEFKISDPEWMVKTPAAKINMKIGPALQNIIQANFSDTIKSFAYKKSLFVTKLSNTINKKRLIINPFSIGSTVIKVRDSIYLKRVTLDPKIFYKEEAVKDD